MSNLNLGGFDIVVHLAESVINQGLELLPNGSTFPLQQRKNTTVTALGVPVPGIGSTPKDVPLLFDAFLELKRPQIVLNQNTSRVSISFAISPASELTYLRPLAAADAALLTAVIPQIPVGGTVVLDCPFGVADVSAVWGNQPVSGRAAVAQAAGVSATISLVVPSADSGGNVLLASSAVNATAIQVTTAAIQAALQTALGGTAIGDTIGNLPLTNPVRLNSGALPVQTVKDVKAQISPAGSPSAISIGVLTAIQPHDPVGAIPAPPGNLSAAGAVIWASNYWTVQLVGGLLKAAHPGFNFTFNQNPPSASFQGAVTIPGGDQPVTVRQFGIKVDSNGGLAVNGHATASGDCWDASFDFDFNFTFSCDPNLGTVLPTTSTPNVTNFNVDKDWLCEIIGIVVGAVVGFIAGAIIGALAGGYWGALIGGIAGAVIGGIGGYFVADKLIDPLALDGVSLDSISVLGGLTLPLPVGGAGLLVQECNFDDLGVIGQLVYVDLAARYRSGSIRLTNGNGFDLDSGVVRTGLSADSDDIADLFWTGSTLQTITGAMFGTVLPANGRAFGSWSLTDLEDFVYAGHSIPAAEIPLQHLVALRMLPGAGLGDLTTGGVRGVGAGEPFVSFAVRTDEGRYAKCRASRDIAGNLMLEYVVYVSPKMCLGSVITLETVSQTVVDSGTDTCTESRSEPPACVRPVVGPLLQPIRTLSFAASSTKKDVETSRLSLEALSRIPGLWDRPPMGPIRPPKCPTGCGPEITIEQTQAVWQVVDRQQRATIQALPSGMVAPLTYQWTALGTDLPVPSGTVDLGGISATYDRNSPILTLLADEGQDLIGSIIVNATDADGRKVRSIRHINSPSRKRLGGCCQATPLKLTPYDANLQLSKAQSIERMYQAGVAQLQYVASTGRVPATNTVLLEDAVQALPGRGTSGRSGKPVTKTRKNKPTRR